MSFEAEYEAFLQQVWWPAVGTLEDLHPEYEVDDFKDGRRFIDFAYIRHPHQVAIEIDGYGTHCRDMTRWQHVDHINRQTYLVYDNWKVVRFVYDEVKEKPRHCQQRILHMMGIWFGREDGSLQVELDFREREVVRLALGEGKPITP
ncbi:hypothetical protein M5X11_24780 [Paenibacillus alginolyticus]|uniref:DUF559 domain-containing protein n=1 Tax=Paenibacillus alginolyticus TaxID=59839 RepID=A0ABT4G8G7_9BACL|nr:DUF559 domain-containing protein [Paenibacillus alginolyticus]MCY9668100.1 hypothetical protein [Paenibacillus alginolyticus]MCY9692477.1 hypothetical protein [Paenibacillus alginolyticus]MEC0144269.1 hypothetical protein [Paenibacillus alginolyticus]